MSRFLALLNRLFEVLLAPLEWAPPLWGLLAVSGLTGIGMLLVFRYTSDQKGIKTAKDRIQAHLLAIRLFQDQLGVVLRAQGSILRAILSYLGHSLKPLGVMLLPILFLLIQLDARLGWVPPRPGETFLLTARVAEPAALDQVTLRLPAGLALSAPPLRIPDKKEISWRIQADKVGDFRVELLLGNQAFPKRVTVATGLARVSTTRVRAGLVEEFLHPGEPPLPKDAPLESIQVHYRRRSLNLGVTQADWLVPFFVFSLAAGYAMKGLLRTEL